jgi:hypothetical protein
MTAPAGCRQQNGRMTIRPRRKTMKTLVDGKRIEEAAEFIARKLGIFVEPFNKHSPLSTALRERCPAYHKGLTNAEKRLAILRALALLQIVIGEDLAGLKYEPGDFEDEAA